MVSGIPLSITGARIALFHKSNENNLADSLIRLASGNRVNRPSDSIPDYFHSEKMKRESRSAAVLLQGIGEGIALTDVAAFAGEQVFNAIGSMRDIVTRYYHENTTDDDKVALEAEFEAYRTTVTSIIDNSTYDGLQLISDNGGNPFRTIAVDTNDFTRQLTISYTADDIADVGALELGQSDEATEMAAVMDELEKAGSYLAKTSAYAYGLNAHYNLTNAKVTAADDSARRSVEVDTGAEMLKATNRSIRNQSSIAMLAQANMYRLSIVQLLG